MTTTDDAAVANDIRNVPLLFVDIDGTVRKGKDQLGRFVNTPGDVEIFPEATEMLHRWRDAGGRVSGVSNQGGVALGIVDRSEMTAAMEETVKQANYQFDLLQYCPHHPDAKDPWNRRCWCRKPSTGMLVASTVYLSEQHPDERYPLDQMLMVGDRPEDRECALAAGIMFLEAEQWRATGYDTLEVVPDGGSLPDDDPGKHVGQHLTFGDFDTRGRSQ